jgi:hypothetical protein
MRLPTLCLATVLVTGAGLSALAQQYFLESCWQNNLSTTGVAIWAGGNEGTNAVTALPAGDSPIAVTGFNRDVVVERTASGSDTAPYASPFDAANNYAFYEAGLSAISFSGGSGKAEGLPQNRVFISIQDQVTTFQLQPYDANNVLYLNRTSPTGTLTLAAPASYNSLGVLATSANGGGAGSLVIQFADGSTRLPISFNASDWYNNPGAALTHFGRIYTGYYASFYTDDPADNNPNLYQTTINIAAQGLNTKPIASLRFTMPPGTAGNTATAIFAVSGTPNVSGPPSDMFVAQSAIGQMTAQSLGYPQAAQDLATDAASARIQAQRYRYVTDTFGSVVGTNRAAVWSIVFPGAFNPADGTIFTNPSNDSINYDTNLINRAEYILRARLRVNPFDADAAQQLILLQEDRMLPLEWCGTEAAGYATTARLSGFPPVNGVSAEIYALQQAGGYYQAACDGFARFLGNPSDAALAEGWNQFLSFQVTNEVAQVVDDYLRSLSEYSSAKLREFQIRSLVQFYDPSQQQGARLPQSATALLADIDKVSAEIQFRLLLISPFENLPIYTSNAAGQVQSLMFQLSRLHESVLLGRITFIAGASGDTNDPSLFYGEYTSSFIPFFNEQLTEHGSISSFKVAWNLAQNFTQYAAGLEDAASNAVYNQVQQAYDYQTSQTELQNQYNNQLVALCGYTSYDSSNNPLPDILFAALPPGDREAAATQVAPDYHLNQTGTIYQQWQNLEAAETRLVDAQVQLSNTFALMLIKKQVGDAIYAGQTNMAALILSNGQQIAGFDVQKGEVQAQGDLEVAQINHDTAEKEAGNSIWSGVISTIGAAAAAALAAPTGGATLAAFYAVASSGGHAGGSIASGYDQAAAALKIGQAQANTARQLAGIDSQITQINSQEQAQMQYLNADINALNLSADLNALRLQAESQKVQVQLAAQGVDEERNKLATLLAQTSYLLKQFARSASLLTENPKFSDNFLIARNRLIQQADDGFILAQQWAFLAAQCFYYEDNCPGDLASKTFLKNVLAARNTAALMANLNGMTSSNALLSASCQGSVSPGYREISLRNNIFQQNQADGTNFIYEPVLVGGAVVSDQATSDAAWTALLQQNLFPDPVYNRKLRLQFATSANPQKVNGIPRNPLFDPFTFGKVIHPYAQGSVQCVGVQVNLRTLGTLHLAPGGVTVVLSQDGTSSLRSLGYCNPDNTFRYFNFGSFKNLFSASLNNFDSSFPGTLAFQDRSLANDLWTLQIVDDGGNGTAILDSLDKLNDIQIRFGFQGYTDQQCH